MDHYIATDRDHTRIFGIGHTQAEAFEDARQGADIDDEHEWVGLLCSRDLYRHVEEHGGGADVRWAVVRGFAILEQGATIHA